MTKFGRNGTFKEEELVGGASQFSLEQGTFEIPVESEIQVLEKQEDSKREMYVQNLTITTTASSINLPLHYGFMIINSGANALQYSKDNNDFQTVVDAGATAVYDNHEQNRFWLRTSVGTTTVRLVTW